MRCDFVVGQRVVCINDDWPEWAIIPGTAFVVPGDVRVPMIGEILTIKEIRVISSPILVEDAVALVFEEIGNGWTFQHFAPLQERKTDISLFKAMLTPAGRVPVDA